MDRGNLLVLDTPEALMGALPGSSTLELTTQAADGDGRDALLQALGTLDEVERVEHLQHDEGPALRARLYVSGEAAQLVAPRRPCWRSAG